MEKNKRLYAIVFVFVFFFSFGVFAQQQEYIAGKLLDAKTEEPVVFANIRIKDRALGIITNVDGSFRIPLVYKEYGDIIEISSMGYQTKEISISELVVGTLNIIKIEPSAIDLQEAIVRGKRKKNLTAKQIVQKAIDAIPRNYPSTSFSTVGYYRDYQLKDEEYINLNEGILEVFDQGFDQLDDDTSNIRLFNFGLNKDFKQDSMAKTAYNYVSNRKVIKKAHLGAYGGNEFRILKIHDAIRNYNVGSYDFVGTLKTDLLKNHSFLRSKDTSSDNEELYNIKFKVIYLNYIANGNIYIAKAGFAIHKFEYTLYNGNKRNKDSKKNKHGHRQKVIFDVVTDYKKLDDKMYLNYISFNNSFMLNIPPTFTAEVISFCPKDNCLSIEYSNVPESKSAILLKNYEIKFLSKEIKLRLIQRLGNKVFLYPNLTDKEFGEMLSVFNNAKINNLDQNEMFDVKIKNIRDTIGNLINEWTQREYGQNREFFVQRVKPNSRAPLDNLFMDKRKPIFGDQPMTKPKDYKEYWMNTPLKENSN